MWDGELGAADVLLKLLWKLYVRLLMGVLWGRLMRRLVKGLRNKHFSLRLFFNLRRGNVNFRFMFNHML